MFAEMLPLLVFTTFAGLAAGAYAVDALCGNGRAGSGAAAPARPWLFPLVCLVLLGLGLCGTLLHLGQPLRFVNGMANPGSMIAQEAYWSIAFGTVIVVDLAVAKAKGAAVRPIRWAGGLVAVGLMVVTGLAYYQSLGLPAWSGAATVPLFLVGDLALGAGLCALLDRSALAGGVLAAANVAAGIVGPLAASAVAAATRAGKLPAQAGGVAVCALAIVGVVLARYAFFAAGMM